MQTSPSPEDASISIKRLQEHSHSGSRSTIIELRLDNHELEKAHHKRRSRMLTLSCQEHQPLFIIAALIQIIPPIQINDIKYTHSLDIACDGSQSSDPELHGPGQSEPVPALRICRSRWPHVRWRSPRPLSLPISHLLHKQHHPAETKT